MPRGPFVPIPDTAKVELIGHDIGDNRPVVVVMHAACSAAPTQSEIGEIGTKFEAWLATMSPRTNGEVQWDKVVVTDLNSSTGPQVETDTVHGGSGGDAPPGLSVVLELFTALRGRRHTGRAFWPVNFTAVDLASGRVSGAEITALVTAFVSLQTALAANTVPSHVVVASRVLHSSTAVSVMIPRPEIGRIRRRA